MSEPTNDKSTETEEAARSNASAASISNNRTASSETSTYPMVLDLVYDKLITSLSVSVACDVHRLIKTGQYPSSELYLRNRRELYPTLYSNEEQVQEAGQAYYANASEPRKRRRLADPPHEEPYEVYIRKNSSSANTSNNKNLDSTTQEPKDVDMKSKEQNPDKDATNTTTGSSQQPNQLPDGATSKSPPVLPQVPSSATMPGQVPSAITSSSTMAPPAPQPAASTVSKTTQPPKNTAHLDIWGRCNPKEPKEMMDCLICGRQVNALRFAPHLDKCMGIGTTVRAAALAASGFVPQQQQQPPLTASSSSTPSAAAANLHKTK
ncbi:expressed unknown protein [Seminavis robusta]|uniref:SAGA-associated factor 11 n=1 Tax=Seminavis robusta TaxID=568900 RepID=A0A9N8DXF0_9STRA|nr:expressed unknown protein [Seminavis robusta]|eukprot:Sro353_g124610.1 n/a (322) ;mRNA; f:55728-56693